ncbi:MAG: MBL fold metallo-hydrolase [Parachlamydiaceae bacterium]
MTISLQKNLFMIEGKMMILERFFYRDLAINTYLIADESSKVCAVIDPVRDVGQVVELIRELHLDLRYILETHVHADFASGAKELKAAFGNQPSIYCSVMGGTQWLPKYVDHPVRDGEEIHLGKTLLLKALHTPGHTPEHLVWLCYQENAYPRCIFTGDLLFVGSVGRPDLLGENDFFAQASALYCSLFEKLARFPDEVEIFPAHGAGSFCGKAISHRPSSTLGYERQFNESLQKMDLSRWIESLKQDMPRAPKAYSKIKEINTGDPKLMKELFESSSIISTAEFMKKLFIDVRSPEAFAAKHLKNSINIPLKGAFSSWLEMVLQPEDVFSLIISSEDTLEPIKKMLAVAGLEKLEGYILWEDLVDGGPDMITTLPLISPGHFQKRVIIDVRTPSEWRSGHIEGARHIELPALQGSLQELSKAGPIATICGSGYRSSIAASILKRAGFSDVANIQGGMQAWKEAKLPIIK